MSDRCGETEASCTCFRLKGHTDMHACDCAGRWTYDEEGNFVPGALPIMSGIVKQFD